MRRQNRIGRWQHDTVQEPAMFDLAAIQAAIQTQKLDGWLLYDFRGINVLAARIAGTEDAHRSRRWAYFIPAHGDPKKLCHRIEPAALDHLPGKDKTLYLRWQEFEAGLAHLVQGNKTIAMEYTPRNGNPYISRVDAGTVELVQSSGVQVVSSGDLIQQFEATWDADQRAMHQEASALTDQAFHIAWDFILEQLRSKGSTTELDVQARILKHFADSKMTTYSPPIVGVGPHSGDPHYSPEPATNSTIQPGDFVLIDLWAKMDKPRAVYSDLTRTCYVGEKVPEKIVEVFNIVAAARDAGIACVKDAFSKNKPLQGWEVDAATRAVIDKAGYGEYFSHRTGHNIGQETHGNGCHMDSLETKEERLVMKNTCFSIEPGIYLPEFGVRSEINVYVDGAGGVHVTGGALQTEVKKLIV
jgi:Xaa-Pro aminopeptidase